MRSIILSIVFSVLTAISLNISAQSENQLDNVLINPTVIVHDTIANPGELQLRIDAIDFTGDDGSVAAITLRIEIDTALIEFQGIQNTSIPGTWFANYNNFLNEITILYNAPFGTGNDINGRLLDLNLFYYGGFTGELNFKVDCEISNVNLQTISDVVYDNGIINPTTAVGETYQDSVIVLSGQSFRMPVLAQGSGFNAITEVFYRIYYDTLSLEYIGNTNSLLGNATVERNLDVLDINWNDDTNPKDLTLEDTLLFIDFQYIGEQNTTTSFIAGSYLKNNGDMVSSGFQEGTVRVIYSVDLLNQPDTAGTSTGDGLFFIDDIVTLNAASETGFSFENWSQSGNTVSTDNPYSFVKQIGNETITANFTPNSYEVILVSSPEDGGQTNGEGFYVYGETVSINANAAEGHEFLNWMVNDEIVSEDMEYVFFMPPGNIELTANFGLLTYTITANPNDTDFGSAIGGGDYLYGSTATVTAIPEPGFKFVSWSEDTENVSFDSLYSFTVVNNRNLIANFQVLSNCTEPVGLSADTHSETEASLSWIPLGSENAWDLKWGITGFDTITEGNLVTELSENSYLLIGLEPDTEYDFYVRARCITGFESPWSDVKTFRTWFIGYVELLNDPDSAGSTVGEGYYLIGEEVNISAMQETGFSFDSWTSADTIVSSNSEFSFIKQAGNDSITANYLVNSYEVILVSTPTSGGETEGSGTFQYGESVLVNANAEIGYEFINWLVNNEVVSEDASYTFIMPANDIQLTAVFELLSYIITATPNNPDYGSVIGAGVYDYGTTATLTATADAGYEFVNWSEGSEAVSFDPIYTFTVENNRSLVANFILPATCSAPVGLFADNLGETEALLNWISTDDESAWDLIWGEMGFDIVTGGNLVEGLTETSYQLGNLDPGIGYDFYVRAVCDDDLNSSWAGPHTFSTWFVGIEDKYNGKQIVIFPNPVKLELNVALKGDFNYPINYRILNSYGITIMEGESLTLNKFSIRLDGFSSGMYIIQFFYENNISTKIFMKY